MIGLAGSHRVGKTTLAREYAKRSEIALVETPTSAVFKEMGISTSGPLPFDVRLDVQEELLRRFDRQYREHMAKPAISDRTPMDLLMYTMADAVHDAVPEALQERLERYANDCFDVTNRHFHLLIVVRPGIQIAQAEGKGTLNKAYIEHLNALVIGLMADQRLKVPHFYMPRSALELKERLDLLKRAGDKAISNATEARGEAVLH